MSPSDLLPGRKGDLRPTPSVRDSPGGGSRGRGRLRPLGGFRASGKGGRRQSGPGRLLRGPRGASRRSLGPWCCARVPAGPCPPRARFRPPGALLGDLGAAPLCRRGRPALSSSPQPRRPARLPLGSRSAPARPPLGSRCRARGAAGRGPRGACDAGPRCGAGVPAAGRRAPAPVRPPPAPSSPAWSPGRVRLRPGAPADAANPGLAFSPFSPLSASPSRSASLSFLRRRACQDSVGLRPPTPPPVGLILGVSD